MKKVKLRVHREHFRTVMAKRKSCPTCGAKLPLGESVWSWGEYLYAKWRTVTHFCIGCYEKDVRPLLEDHAKPCGCVFELVGYRGTQLPEWLQIDKKYCEVGS